MKTEQPTTVGYELSHYYFGNKPQHKGCDDSTGYGVMGNGTVTPTRQRRKQRNLSRMIGRIISRRRKRKTTTKTKTRARSRASDRWLATLTFKMRAFGKKECLRRQASDAWDEEQII